MQLNQVERDRIEEILKRPKTQQLAQVVGFSKKGPRFLGDCPLHRHSRCKANFFVPTRKSAAFKQLMFGCSRKATHAQLVKAFWKRGISLTSALLVIESQRVPWGTVSALLSRFTRQPSRSEIKSLKKRASRYGFKWKVVAQTMRRRGWSSRNRDVTADTVRVQADLDCFVSSENLQPSAG